MKQRILSFIAFLMLVMGLSLLLYPTVSSFLNAQRQRRAIFNYVTSVGQIPEADYSAYIEKAQEFNKKLTGSQYLLMNLTDTLRDEYYSTLDVTGDGILGYISVLKGSIMLPVYHGTSEAVLQEGAGHIEGSSFPIEGESVHAVISGHRGLPSSLLFTNLDKVKVGDTFILYVLSESYIYRVRSIETVEPTDVQSLRIEAGRNLCTLVTCTPFGVNTHRLLVRGERIEEPSEGEEPADKNEEKNEPPKNDDVQANDTHSSSTCLKKYITVLLLCFGGTAIIAVGAFIFRSLKNKGRRKQ